MTPPRHGVLQALEQVLGGAAALRAAVAVDLFGLLPPGGATAADIARGGGLDPRAAGRVLEVLAALGLVTGSGGGRYTPVEGVNRLVRRMVPAWDRLPEVLQGGDPPMRMDDPDAAARTYPYVLELLASSTRRLAHQAAGRLARPDLQVLDVGAGAAPWSLALVEREPTMHVTALDLPEVLAVTRRVVAREGRSQQFAYLPGDVFAVSLPPGAFDLVLLGNLCHLFGADRNRALFRRLRGALATGGVLAVLDGLGGGQASLASACYLLGLALRAPDGDLHSEAAYRAWLVEAGFAEVTVEPLGDLLATHLIRAR